MLLEGSIKIAGLQGMTVLVPDLVFASSGGEEGGFRRLPWRLSWLQQFLCHELQASDVDCSKIMSLDPTALDRFPRCWKLEESRGNWRNSPIVEF
jgi:hypothetical protein